VIRLPGERPDQAVGNSRIAHTDAKCWPSSVRDWLAAHCAVRFGRLDRVEWARTARRALVHRLARDHASVGFKTSQGFTVFVPCDYTGQVLSAMAGELFHATLLQFVQEIISPGDIVVDGGSYVGFFSLLAAHSLQGRGRVFAFEPQPDTFALLRENVEFNGLVGMIQIEQKALTNANGAFDFSIVVDEPMMSSLLAPENYTFKSVRVIGVRLDDYLAAAGHVRPDVIKLDLEGAEPLALEGMSESLKAARVLLFEVNAPQLAQMGLDPIRMIKDTAAMGSYESILFVEEGENRIMRWEPESFPGVIQRYKFLNVICAKRGSLPEKSMGR
jgi:FkbM family methyltransferase